MKRRLHKDKADNTQITYSLSNTRLCSAMLLLSNSQLLWPLVYKAFYNYNSLYNSLYLIHYINFPHIDIEECQKNPCHVNAICSNVDGSYSCKCQNGYIGNGFNCEGIIRRNITTHVIIIFK